MISAPIAAKEQKYGAINMPLSASILSRLQHQHETLLELIDDATEEELKQPVIPGKWSAFEQIVHLVTYQPVLLQRLQKIESEDSPVFGRYVADTDPAFREGCKKSLKELLTQLKEQRSQINNHLSTLSEQVLQRSARHPKFGTMTIIGWTEFFLLHEAHHLFSIFKLVREGRVSLQQ